MTPPIRAVSYGGGVQSTVAAVGHGGVEDRRVALAVRVSIRTVTRWRAAGGLSERQADRAACALGLHPAEIWPSWFNFEGYA